MSRTRMLEEYKIWKDLTEKEQQWVIDNREKFSSIEEALKAGAKPKKVGGACSNVNRVEILEDKLKQLVNPVKSMADDPGMIAWTEERNLGVAITYSRVDSCDTSQVNTTCKEYLDGKRGFLIFGVVIQSLREVKVKNGTSAGQKMAFITVSDSTCALDVCVFADTYKEYSEFLLEGNTILMRAEKDKKKDSLIAKEIWQI